MNSLHLHCARDVAQKCFLVCAVWKHNIHFESRAFARPRNIKSNNVSATMCPRFPIPLYYKHVILITMSSRKSEEKYVPLACVSEICLAHVQPGNLLEILFEICPSCRFRFRAKLACLNEILGLHVTSQKNKIQN